MCDDPLGVEHDLADLRCQFVDEPEDLFAQEGGIREEERRVEAIDEQAGYGDRAVVVVRVPPCPARTSDRSHAPGIRRGRPARAARGAAPAVLCPRRVLFSLLSEQGPSAAAPEAAALAAGG